MFVINIYSHFSAAHRLDGYNGACANIHGHNWKVRLSVACIKTDSIGMTIDFKVLKKQFEKILSEFDHKYLNDLEIFSKHNPTSEFIAKIIFEKVSTLLNNSNFKVKQVEVWESEKYSVVYSPD
ncbi:MAG: 6-carboxytetrahydropterin synthase QueD [Candidatus Cloacimonetes bacterium]|nr:6-carboxytetrahydropterin synthase QueD [Candidatus Cloacimonadota bacterium]MBL7085781.1 6-carboxytetrahydropterin synthase QueD [Candidatus Cloacimonadota bacterium]